MNPALLFRTGVLMFVVIAQALSCSCSPAAYAPACEKLSRSEVVFLGTVLAPEPDPTHPGATSTRVYRFRVDAAYKGLPVDTAEVTVNPDNFTSCRTRYLTGRQYLIFAHPVARTGQLMSGACAGSKLADYAKEDIQFLEAYRHGQAGNFVYGRVLQWLTDIGRPMRDKDAPVAGASVVLMNSAGTRTQTTTATGDFRFDGVPPGSYTLSAQLSPYIANPPALSIDVPDVGCVERFPVLEARAGLSGSLVNEAGKPAQKMAVELLRRNGAGEWQTTAQSWTRTDDAGRFTFEGLPDGEYLLGYAIWGDRPSIYSPYPTTYYPGVSDRASASVIHLSPLQTIGNLRIPLSQPHTPRSIRVEVLWPDGHPPEAHLLQLFGGPDLLKNEGISFPNRPAAPHNGIIEVIGYAERAYDLSVRFWVDDLGGPVPHDKQRIARSEVVHLPPGKAPALVKLVLTRTLLADEDR